MCGPSIQIGFFAGSTPPSTSTRRELTGERRQIDLLHPDGAVPVIARRTGRCIVVDQVHLAVVVKNSDGSMPSMPGSCGSDHGPAGSRAVAMKLPPLSVAWWLRRTCRRGNRWWARRCRARRSGRRNPVAWGGQSHCRSAPVHQVGTFEHRNAREVGEAGIDQVEPAVRAHDAGIGMEAGQDRIAVVRPAAGLQTPGHCRGSNQSKYTGGASGGALARWLRPTAETTPPAGGAPSTSGRPCRGPRGPTTSSSSGLGFGNGKVRTGRPAPAAVAQRTGHRPSSTHMRCARGQRAAQQDPAPIQSGIGVLAVARGLASHSSKPIGRCGERALRHPRTRWPRPRRPHGRDRPRT